MSLADIASSGGDVESAQSILGAAADHDLGNVDLQVRYANALLDAGRAEHASKVAARAGAQHPHDAALALKLGQLQLRAHDPAGAAVTYQRVVGHGPESVAALNGLGVARIQQNDLPAATETFRRAVAMSPRDVASRNNLALALILQGRSEEAVPLLQSLAAEPGAPGRIKHNLALAYAGEGNAKEAAAVLSGLVGAGAAAREAASLANAQREAPGNLLGELAPVEVLGSSHASTAAALPEPGQQPVAPQAAATQAPLPEAEVKVSPAPRTAFSSTPLPLAQTAHAGPQIQAQTAVPQKVAAPPPVKLAAVVPPPVVSAPPLTTPAAPAVVASTAGANLPPTEEASAPDDASQAIRWTDGVGKVTVHIAAVPTRGAALTLWQNLTSRVPDLLATRAPTIVRHGHGAESWSLGVGGFQDSATAEQFCRALRERGPNCKVGRL